jgi:hypothetical protein
MDSLPPILLDFISNKPQIREMRHQAGVRYLDFTPVMLISGACIIGARYIGMGIGDKALFLGELKGLFTQIHDPPFNYLSRHHRQDAYTRACENEKR